jgi:hypothetical protein
VHFAGGTEDSRCRSARGAKAIGRSERETGPFHSILAITAFVNPFASDVELAVKQGRYWIAVDLSPLAALYI